MDSYIEHLVVDDQESLAKNEALLGSAITLETARQLSSALEKRLQLGKESLRKNLLENYDTYLAAVSEAGKAQSAISQLLQGVDDLESTFGDEETGIRVRLLGAINNESKLVDQLHGNQAVLHCLRYLSKLNGDLRAMDTLVRSNKLLDASKAVLGIEKDVEGSDIIAGARIKDSLLERISLAKLNIKENALRTIRELFVVDTSADCVQLCVVSVNDQSPKDLAHSLFEALDVLFAGNEVKDAFSTYFVDAFAKPVLSTPNAIKFVDQTFCSRTDTGSKDSKLLSIWTSCSGTDIADLVLERCFYHSIPATRSSLSSFRSDVDALLAFEQQLIDLHLLDKDSSSQQRPISEAVGRLETLYVARRCDAAFCHIRTLAEDSSFDLHAFETHERWTPELVHSLSKDVDCEVSPVMIQVAGVLVSEFAGSHEAKLANVFPRCAVSKSAHGLVSAAYKLVNEASLAASASSSLPQALCSAALDLFDLYRALFFTLHRAELTKIPALAWQFFNDCMYLSHHVQILGQFIPALYKELGGTVDAGNTQENWGNTARLFVGVGNAHIASLVEREAKELKEMVNGSSQGFFNASSEAEKARLSKMAKQVKLAVKQLTRATKPPAVSPHIFHSTLGHYIDAVFEATIDCVTDVRDIGADDSQVLSDHCQSLCSLTGLFQLDSSVLAGYRDLEASFGLGGPEGYGDDDLLGSDDDETDSSVPQQNDSRETANSSRAGSTKLAQTYCKLSDKLLQLADILVISRADILARRRAGLLSQFSVDELVGLIRALFSDTPERAHDIEIIKSLG
ncbi:ribosome biogenesis protein ytm1 [Dipsacomyces acuminosporus]|nr:ribosome biogenesis protein ytm1 [Dipsacomyces acuminosporus]